MVLQTTILFLVLSNPFLLIPVAELERPETCAALMQDFEEVYPEQVFTCMIPAEEL